MKVLKWIFYIITILIMGGCVAVLVCAFNPSLTQSLAQTLYGAGIEDSQPGESNAGTADGITDSLIVWTGEDNGIDWNGLNALGDSIYVTPSKEQINTPSQVSGKSGYEQIREDAEQVEEEEGSLLQNELETGDTGDNLHFDAKLYPYYAMLTEPMQKLYRQIYANATELVTSFSPAVTVNVNQLKNVFEAVYNDQPELFWLETGYSCKYLRNGQCLEITLQYNETVNNLEAAKGSFQTRAQEILAGAVNLGSDADKEKYVHDMLMQSVEYNTSAAMNQSAYSALVKGQSVCAGYARAFQYLLQQLGIPCYYCTGYSGEDHAWNIVCLDNIYYNVDVTWDDTNPSTYDYFNKTDAEFSDTHMRRELSVYLPACNGSAAGDVNSDLPNSGEGSNAGDNGAEDNGSQSLINPDPQKPLSWVGSFSGSNDDNQTDSEKEENLLKAGITEEEVMETMKEYYEDCLKQIAEAGIDLQQFSNVIPESLWRDVELAYSNEGYRRGYADEALKKVGAENFAIQLQAVRLGGGYYRLYHNISMW